jgi:plastocyanin
MNNSNSKFLIGGGCGLALVVGFAVMSGCPEKSEAPAPSADSTATAEAPPSAPAVDPSPDAGQPQGTAPAGTGNGSIEGQVAFAGVPPEMQPLKRGSDPICSKTEAKDEQVLVKDGKLQNVVVRLTKNAPSGGPVPSDPVVVDQQGCMYRPRVQVARAGQAVMIKNSDGTLHNVHTYVGAKTLFNQAQPPRAAPVEKKFETGAGVIKFKCDVHPWMTGYVVVSENSFFHVTGEDGKYSLKDVPPGQYMLEAWHERFGTQSLPVEVPSGGVLKTDVTFGEKRD